MRKIKLNLFIAILFVIAGISLAPVFRPDRVQNTYVLDHTVTDHGAVTTEANRSLKDLLTTIGTSQKATIKVPHAGSGNTTTYTVSTTYDASSYTNVTIEVENGAIFSVASAKTLTIGGPFEAGLYQVFSGTGTVTFGRGAVRELYPEWWGAKADWDGSTGTDDITAINAAITSASASGGGTVKIIGRMKTLSPVIVKTKVNLEGIGSPRAQTWGVNTAPNSEIHNAGTGVTISVDGDNTGYRNAIKHLYISGNASSSHGIQILNQVYDGTIEDCVIATHGGDGINATTAVSWKIINNLIYDNTYGIRTGADTNGWDITGNHIQANNSYGIYGDSWWGVNFSGNTVEGNTTREMYVRTSRGSNISGNYFEGSPIGLYVDNYSAGLNIEANFFQGYTTAVLFTDATYELNAMVVMSNWFRGCTNGVVLNAGCTFSNFQLGPNFFAQADGTADRMTNTRYAVNGTLNNSIIIDDQASQWLASTKYYVGNTVINDGGKVYTCDTEGTSAGAGGPTGTGSNIVDGTTQWDYTAARQYGLDFYSNARQRGLREIKSFTSGSNLGYVVERGAGQTLADDGEQDTEMEEQGFFFFSASDDEYAIGYVLADGTVALLHNSVNVGTTEDNDTTWNIFRDAATTTIHVQNKRGSSQNYMFLGFDAFY